MGDLILNQGRPHYAVYKPMPKGAVATKAQDKRAETEKTKQAAPVTVTRKPIDMKPVIELIVNNVQPGSWEIQDDQGNDVSDTYVPPRVGVPPAKPVKVVGAIVPFYLSVSLIVRHTAEGHEQVATLLRSVRNLIYSVTEAEAQARAEAAISVAPPAKEAPADQSSVGAKPAQQFDANISHPADSSFKRRARDKSDVEQSKTPDEPAL